MTKATYTVDASAAISRIAATLAPLLTNSVIDSISAAVRWPIVGTNKTMKIASLLEAGWSRVCLRQIPAQKLEDVISTMTLEGYRRFTAKAVEMKHEHVDEIVKAMRVLRLNGSDLAARKWRAGFTEERVRPKTKLRPTANTAAAVARPGLPMVHHDMVAEIRALLSATSSMTPQQRGRRLEQLVHTVLEAERLRPRGPIRNPGEELDRSFTIENIHYLLECKWEDEPIGFPSVRDFIGKVSRKAEGTFGVFLSMSGFVGNINMSATLGQRLNCVGLNGSQFMEVVEGRTTWSQLVDAARRTASDSTEFHARMMS